MSPDAQDLVWRGWDWRFKPQTTETLHEARQSFERALQLDPRSTNARIGLASTLIAISIFDPDAALEQDRAITEQLLNEALDFDPESPDAHRVMGELRGQQKRLPEARIEFETALQLDPSSSGAASGLGWTLFYLGQFAAAIQQAEKAVRLSPRDPFLWGRYLLLGSSLARLGRLDEAVEFTSKARAANPHIAVTHFVLAAELALKGDLAGGKVALQEGLKLSPQSRSIEFWRQQGPCSVTPVCSENREKTFFAGLRLLGLPEN